MITTSDKTTTATISTNAPASTTSICTNYPTITTNPSNINLADCGVSISKNINDYASWTDEWFCSPNIYDYLKPNLVIIDVIFNGPATIIKWSDKTKSVVKCSANDSYDKEMGFCLAVCKRFLYRNINKYIKVLKDEIMDPSKPYCKKIAKRYLAYEGINYNATVNKFITQRKN